MEHTIWLSMMYPRLKLLKQFLRKDGAVFIQLDDNEQHYAKVICDEIFGRNNFISCITWHKKRGKDNSSRYFSITHDNILCYAKNAQLFYINRIELEDSTKSAYKNPDNDNRGLYRLLGLWSRQQGGSEFEYTMDDGKKFSKRLWLVNHDTMKRLEAENRIVVIGDKLYRKLFLTENKGSIPETIWIGLSNNANAKDELKALFGGNNLFDTPKPELLLKRIVEISTNPGDYVLDSFLGSGTTAAVAHKMGRRYIGIEMGEQAKTHCAARLKKVIDGEQGGISEAAQWKGGGGFRFFSLGVAIFDSERRIKSDISFENLSAHIYFTETKTPLKKPKRNSTFLGVHEGTAYALLYNGILGDKNVSGGNVLTHATLSHIMHDIDVATEEAGGEFEYDQIVIYGEAIRLPHVNLASNNIIFKQTPYDIKVW
jgi:adenine-specific DNA-methyltransferase